ncbi:MAG: hypothetical protein ABI986_13835 [Chloroflexota bacterium]
MNKKSFISRLFRYFSRMIYGKNPGNMSPTEKRQVVVETNLRWEDDGGPVVEIAKSNEQAVENDPAKLTDMS